MVKIKKIAISQLNLSTPLSISREVEDNIFFF